VSGGLSFFTSPVRLAREHHLEQVNDGGELTSIESIRALNPILEDANVCTCSPAICVEQRESGGRLLDLIG
jgi:hypothetical protein